MTVSVHAVGGNWTIEVIYVPRGIHPSFTVLQVRDANGAISLPRTPFTHLTEANWSSLHALYRDANPWDDAVATGDALVLDQGAYPARSTIAILDDGSQLTTNLLR